MDKPRKPHQVMCSKCLHGWVGFYLPLPIADAARIMGNLTCPNCGAPSKDIYVGDAAKAHAPKKRTSASGLSVRGE